jgi:MoxR-like ATPase
MRAQTLSSEEREEVTESGLSDKDRKQIDHLAGLVVRLRNQIGQRIVGLDHVIDHLLFALFSGGHTLLIGVPGLAKTLLISTLAEAVSLNFNRIQFTPDLMPSDITGTDIITTDGEQRTFSFRKGPVFANIILADEINRTPPKTQASLMEAMEEGQISSGGKTYKLDPPFFVLATQNPIEQEGTYPLPVAQLDRFMFSIALDYPKEEEEYRILRMTTSKYKGEVGKVLNRSEVMEAMEIVRRIGASDVMLRYAMALSRATRSTEDGAPAFIREWLNWGCGPRATQALILGAKARAMLAGRYEVSAEDVRAVVPAVLRHRAIISYHAESDGLTLDEIIEELMESVPAPDGYGTMSRKRGFLATLWN